MLLLAGFRLVAQRGKWKIIATYKKGACNLSIERRRNRLYEYRKVRVDGRVRSIYVGKVEQPHAEPPAPAPSAPVAALDNHEPVMVTPAEAISAPHATHATRQRAREAPEVASASPAPVVELPPVESARVRPVMAALRGESSTRLPPVSGGESFKQSLARISARLAANRPKT